MAPRQLSKSYSLQDNNTMYEHTVNEKIESFRDFEKINIDIWSICLVWKYCRTWRYGRQLGHVYGLQICPREKFRGKSNIFKTCFVPWENWGGTWSQSLRSHFFGPSWLIWSLKLSEALDDCPLFIWGLDVKGGSLHVFSFLQWNVVFIERFFAAQRSVVATGEGGVGGRGLGVREVVLALNRPKYQHIRI